VTHLGDVRRAAGRRHYRRSLDPRSSRSANQPQAVRNQSCRPTRPVTAAEPVQHPLGLQVAGVKSRRATRGRGRALQRNACPGCWRRCTPSSAAARIDPGIQQPGHRRGEPGCWKRLPGTPPLGPVRVIKCHRNLRAITTELRLRLSVPPTVSRPGVTPSGQGRQTRQWHRGEEDQINNPGYGLPAEVMRIARQCDGHERG
jgi:hypothetical protein